jgi:hypothetical protein
MANKITIKRAAGVAASPLPGSAVLSSGELAYSYNNMQASTTGAGDNADVGGVDNIGSGKLFIGGPDDVAPVIVGGAYYTDKVDHFITSVVDGVQMDSKVLSTDASGNLVYNDGNINFDDGSTSLDLNHQRALYEGDTTSIKVQNAIANQWVEIKPHSSTFVGDLKVDGSPSGHGDAVLTVLGNQIDAQAGINTPTAVASSLGGLTVLDNQVLNGNLTMTASKAISGVGTINTIDVNATGDVDVTGTITANALDINVSLDVNNIQADVGIIAGNSDNNNIGGVIKSDAGEFDTIEGHQGTLTELTGNSSTVTQLRDAIDVTLTGDVHGNVSDITLVGGNTAAGGAGVTISNMDIQTNVVGENEIDMTNVSVIDFKDDEFVLDDVSTGQTIGLKNAVLQLEDRIQGALGGQSGSQTSSTVATLQSEVDTTQIGAGLAVDGTYAPNAAKSYINASTSLRGADEDLSDAVQTLSDRHDTEDTLLRTQLTDTSYTDNVVVAKVVDRTISLSGDVAGSVVYNASGNVDIDAVIQSQQVEDSMILNSTITNSKIVNSDFNFSTTDQNTTTTTGHVELGTNLPFSGTTNEVTVTTADISGNDGVVVGLPNDVTITNDLNVGGNTVITGNLNVEGTTTTINTSEVTVEDHVLRIANNTNVDSALDGSGIELGNTGTHSLLWNDALDTWSTASNDGIQAGNGKVHYGDTVVFTATQGSNIISFNSAVINDANIDGGTWT